MAENTARDAKKAKLTEMIIKSLDDLEKSEKNDLLWGRLDAVEQKVDALRSMLEEEEPLEFSSSEEEQSDESSAEVVVIKKKTKSATPKKPVKILKKR